MKTKKNLITCAKKLTITTSILFFSCYFQTIQAQNAQQINGTLNYPLSNPNILNNFGYNPYELNRLDCFFNKLINDTTIFINKLHINSYSSPDGLYEHNDKLSKQRLYNLNKYINEKFNIESKVRNISLTHVAEDWDGLQKQLEAINYPYLKLIRNIISSEPNFDKRENKIKKIKHGKAYRDLCNSIFPTLRRVEINIEYTSQDTLQKQASLALPYSLENQENDSEENKINQNDLIQQQREFLMYNDNSRKRRRELLNSQKARYSYFLFNQPQDLYPKLSVKTNILALAGLNPNLEYTTPIPNIAIEAYFLRNYSLELSFAYSNWAYNNNKKFQGISAYTIEPRYWLIKDNKYKGLFIGIYAQFGDYNTQKYHDIVSSEGNKTGKYHSEGLSVGYLQPIYGPFAAELNFKFGYVHSKVNEYKQDSNYNLFLYSHNKDRFDITGTCINLMYRF